MGFIIRGVLWDIPILIFAYVPFGGPITVGFTLLISGSFEQRSGLGFSRFLRGSMRASCRFQRGVLDSWSGHLVF